MDYWTPENTDAQYPTPSANHTLLYSDALIEDGSYLRFKNIQIGYHIPIGKITADRVKWAYVFLSGQNLITITNYTGLDPEVNQAASGTSFNLGWDKLCLSAKPKYYLGPERRLLKTLKNQNMKKILILILLGLASLLPMACTDTLIEEPRAIASSTFYNTESEVIAATNSVYDHFYSDWNLIIYNMTTEVLSDYCIGNNDYSYLNSYDKINSTFVTRSQQVWTTFMKVVRNCNIVIDKVPTGNELSEEQKASYVAEARFMRSLVYFFMVRLYGGLTLRTEENYLDIACPRSPAEAVFDLIIADLQDAETNLPDAPRASGTPAKITATALLAEVYLQMGRYAEAKNKAKEVIDANVYSLVPVAEASDFTNIFGPTVGTSSEEVFYIKYTRENQYGWKFVNAPLASGAGLFKFGWTVLYTDNGEVGFIKEWDENDLRKQYNLFPFSVTGSRGTDNRLFIKFVDPDVISPTAYGNDWPVLRYADVLLTYAEATCQEAGAPTEESINYLNMIRRRGYGYNPNTASPVDYQLADYPTKEAFMDILADEQGYETMLEGKRWLFLVRLGRAEQAVRELLGAASVSPQLYLWPIPTIEFELNPALNINTDQNPGY